MAGLLGLVVGQVHAISMAGGCWRLPGDAAGEACARVRSEAPGEARSRESITGCEGAGGREANHACGEVGLMSCGAVARAARSAMAERSADIDFT